MRSHLTRKEPTQRHIEFPAYKAQREAMPEDLSLSMPHIFRLTEAFNIQILRAPGYEADDIIGTLVKRAEQKSLTSYMVTPDKDFAQLVSDKSFMFKPGRAGNDAEVLGIPEVLEKWGISNVSQVIDILGLWGDASDNIPGIPGIGEKTAKTLISRFGSIEALLENTNELKGKQKENVTTYAEQARLSKRLVTIDCQVPLDFEIDSLARREVNSEKLKSIFREFEFTTLSKRLFDGKGSTIPTESLPDDQQLDLFQDATTDSTTTNREPIRSIIEDQEENLKTIDDVKHEYLPISTQEERTKLISTLSTQKRFCFDTETTGLDPKTAKLLGIAFCCQPHTGYYVLFPPNETEIKDVLSEFGQLFGDPKIEKIGHNLKYDIAVLNHHGLKIEGALFDTMIAHYLVNPEGRHKMDILAKEYLDYEPVPITDLIGEKKNDQITMAEVPVEKVVEYAVEDADITLQLHKILQSQLEERNGTYVFNEVEIPLIPVLIEMEYNGITLDKNVLKDYSKIIEKEIERLEKSIFRGAGTEFNIDSPKQLGEVLFEGLCLDPNAKRTSKSKQYTTSEQVLSRLAPKHEIVQNVLEYRSYRKLKGTYVDALPNTIFPDTGRIHTNYNQSVTATGRIQSQNPNLQNIPIKTEKGREIRKAFVPRSKDYLLLSADYSQIELRIIAELSGDEAMLEAFQNNLDIHRSTASKIYGVPLDEVTDEMRRTSKMVNFGIIYGISAFGLSQRLNIQRKEAKFIIDQYLTQYPQIKQYMDDTITFAREKGYVETIKGRRRYIRDINSRNGTIRAAAERNAINAPIQGSAADMIKLAMIRIHKELSDGEYKTKLLIQVHDELVFDMFKEERERIIPLVTSNMENAIDMKVPIVVEVGVGSNWLEAH